MTSDDETQQAVDRPDGQGLSDQQNPDQQNPDQQNPEPADTPKEGEPSQGQASQGNAQTGTESGTSGSQDSGEGSSTQEGSQGEQEEEKPEEDEPAPPTAKTNQRTALEKKDPFSVKEPEKNEVNLFLALAELLTQQLGGIASYLVGGNKNAETHEVNKKDLSKAYNRLTDTINSQEDKLNNLSEGDTLKRGVLEQRIATLKTFRDHIDPEGEVFNPEGKEANSSKNRLKRLLFQQKNSMAVSEEGIQQEIYNNLKENSEFNTTINEMAGDPESLEVTFEELKHLDQECISKNMDQESDIDRLIVTALNEGTKKAIEQIDEDNDQKFKSASPNPENDLREKIAKNMGLEEARKSKGTDMEQANKGMEPGTFS